MIHLLTFSSCVPDFIHVSHKLDPNILKHLMWVADKICCILLKENNLWKSLLTVFAELNVIHKTQCN